MDVAVSTHRDDVTDRDEFVTVCLWFLCCENDWWMEWSATIARVKIVASADLFELSSGNSSRLCGREYKAKVLETLKGRLATEIAFFWLSRRIFLYATARISFLPTQKRKEDL